MHNRISKYISRAHAKHNLSFIAKYQEVKDDIREGLYGFIFEIFLLAFCIGIAIYFSPVTRFHMAVYGALALLCAGLSYFFRQRAYYFAIFLLATGLAFTGFLYADIHTKRQKHVILPTNPAPYMLTGWVYKKSASKSLTTLYVNIESFIPRSSNQSLTQIPKRVRIRAKAPPLTASDTISLTAMLSAPSALRNPNAYHNARNAYYQNISGTGFAISKIKIKPTQTPLTLPRRIAHLRDVFSQHIQRQSPAATAGLQSALLSGDKSAINTKQQDILRQSGLAHILAISGLHMGILAGGAYFILTYLCTLYAPLARRYDMRKFAAIGALAIASLYLIISGASISTLRAYIMAGIMFSAVIINARAFSVRSIALAAALCVLLRPDSLLNVGFHMSFAATLSLVLVFNALSARKSAKTPRIKGQYVLGFFKQIALSSFIAGTATSLFAGMHFTRIAKFGFFANIIAMPLFSLIVMPVGFLAVLLMPFGLERPALWVMGQGLQIILWFGESIAPAHQAFLATKQANGALIALAGLSFFLLAPPSLAIRSLGVGLLGITIIAWGLFPSAQMRISKAGNIAFWRHADSHIVYTNNQRKERGARKEFMAQNAKKNSQHENYYRAENAHVFCDVQACFLEIKNTPITIINTPEYMRQVCKNTNISINTQSLIIAPQHSIPERLRLLCPNASIIDKVALQNLGTHTLYFSKKGVRIRTLQEKNGHHFPWDKLANNF